MRWIRRLCLALAAACLLSGCSMAPAGVDELLRARGMTSKQLCALVGITALIPIVGAWVGLIVGAFMIGMESLTQALIFVIFLLVLQQVEGNLIYPRVVGSSVGLPPIWVLAAVTVGGSLWGIAGMLFAVPVCSILHALLRLGVHRRLEAQAAAGASVPAPTPEEKM